MVSRMAIEPAAEIRPMRFHFLYESLDDVDDNYRVVSGDTREAARISFVEQMVAENRRVRIDSIVGFSAADESRS